MQKNLAKVGSKENFKDHLYALIVAGGGGTRLWPRSRNKTPKQFLKIFGNKTLTQITFERFRKILPTEKIYCVTVSEEYKKEIIRQIPDFIKDNIIVEPIRRNSAVAHCIGALYIYEKDKDAVILNDSADHLINHVDRYIKTACSAAEAAFSGDWLIATGIHPTYPNIGYGYVKKGEKFGVFGGRNIYKLNRFTEKPELSVAKKYLSSGDYYWHGNQFVWRADSILKSISKYEPKIGKSLKEISKFIGTAKEEVVLKTEYEKIPEISIEYAVGERATNFLLVVADYDWTDIGDWNEVWKNLSKDESGNVVIDGDEEGGDVINIDTSDALIHKNGRMIAVIDVDNIIVVDTPTALLICAKSRAQNVKKIVDQLKEQKRIDLL